MAHATTFRTMSARGSLALALALLMGLALLVAVPPQPAQADDGAAVERAFGPNRYATAAAISERTFDPAMVDVVYVGRGDEWADALAAGAVAARAGAPVLLTDRDFIPEPIVDELQRLDPERVVIVGGTGAVSPAVEEQLGTLFPSGIFVERIGGTNRFDTAARLAVHGFPQGAEVVYMGTGTMFPDILSGVAAAAVQGSPMLLAAPELLPEDTARAITELAPDEVVVLGGQAAISDAVAAQIEQLGPQVTRLAGEHRFATAEAVVTEHFMGAREVFIATAEEAPDALAGGAAVAYRGGALLLAARGQLLPSTAQVLRALNPRRVTLLGGTAALQEEVAQQVRQAVADTTALRVGEVPDLMLSGAPTMQSGQALWAATLDGRHEIASNPARGYADIGANWSPDGTHVAFSRVNAGGRIADPVKRVMNYAEGQRSVAVQSTEDCDGSIGAAQWRPGSGDLQLLVRCVHGEFYDPDHIDIAVIGMDGSERAVVPPAGVAYVGAAWAPNGQLSVVARTGDDHAVRVLQEADWDGGAGTLVTDQVDNANIMWESTQGGDVLFHHETVGDEQRLYATIDGATSPALFAGEQEDNDGRWQIWDTHRDLGVLLVTERGGDGRTKGVADIVGFDGQVTSLVGPNDYQRRTNNLVDPRFLPDGERVLIGETRFRGERDSGVRSVSDGIVRVHDLDSGAAQPLLGHFVFLIPEDVNPAAD
jgi:putative cell wall-binding protein